MVRALLEGEQVLDVRKGGLREEGRHFGVRAPRFWLYPTTEHQRPELLKPAYARWVAETEALAARAGSIRFDGWAECVGVATVTEPEVLDALDSKVVWSRGYVESRFNWKRRDPLWVLALRTYRLEEPRTVPFREEYAGCTSWVSMHGLPPDPRSLPSAPALSDVAFEARLRGASEAVPGGFRPPA